jgi:AraC-like DNA-binding protein
MSTESVSFETAKILLTYASSINLDAVEIFDAIGFDPEVLKDTTVRISLSQYQAMWKELARRSNDKDFGLHFGENTHDFCRGNVLCAVMMNCPNVGEGIQKFIKYHRLLSDLIFPELQIKHEFGFFTWNTRPDIVLDIHQMGSNLIMLNSVLHCLGGHELKIEETRFMYERPADISEHERIFSVPLSFDQDRNEIVFRRKDLSLPIFLSNPDLLCAQDKLANELLQRLSNKNIWTDKVIKCLSNSLLNGECPDIDAVAYELAISKLNLQKRLNEENSSYQNIYDQIRKEIAVDYIKKPDVSFYDVSFLLGFSEQSSFNHAFKRWTGLSPKEYKNKMTLALI